MTGAGPRARRRRAAQKIGVTIPAPRRQGGTGRRNDALCMPMLSRGGRSRRDILARSAILFVRLDFGKLIPPGSLPMDRRLFLPIPGLFLALPRPRPAVNLVPNRGSKPTRRAQPDSASCSSRAVDGPEHTARPTPTMRARPEELSVGQPCRRTRSASRPAHGGVGYGGFLVRNVNDYHEYVQAPLTSPLSAATTYYVEFWVSLADTANGAVDRLGAFFQAGPSTSAATRRSCFPTGREPRGHVPRRHRQLDEGFGHVRRRGRRGPRRDRQLPRRCDDQRPAHAGRLPRASTTTSTTCWSRS
jgi:hypothetical protein